MNLWLVGQNVGTSWEFEGIFSSQAAAEATCKNAAYFVAAVLVDEVIPDGSTDWPGAYRPREPVAAP